MSRISLSKADITDVEEAFVVDAVRSGWVAPLGPHVDSFEAEIANRVGVAHALALSSGTAALHLALLGLGAGPETFVVCSSMTFAASANAIVYTGASPVFVDSYMNDGNVDAELLLQAVDSLRREGKRVVAAMVVDLFGRCANYDVLSSGLADRQIPLLEDAAESLGASQGNTCAGAFGRAAALSFNGNKVMTTSGGGMLLSNDFELINRARYLSTQARQPVAWYEHSEIGYNYRLSNVLAALGRAQLSRLDEMIGRRRKIRQMYVEALRDIDGLTFLGPEDDHEQNCWLTAVLLHPGVSRRSPRDLIASLELEDIEARYLWKPMHLQPAFNSSLSYLNGNSANLFKTGLTVPSGSALTDLQVNQVIDTIRKTMIA